MGCRGKRLVCRNYRETQLPRTFAASAYTRLAQEEFLYDQSPTLLIVPPPSIPQHFLVGVTFVGFAATNEAIQLFPSSHLLECCHFDSDGNMWQLRGPY